MRDHRKLLAFQAADALVTAVRDVVRRLPAHERYAPGSPLSRAAVSAASNIVEGCARESASDFARFPTIVYASAREAQYQIDVAIRFGHVKPEDVGALRDSAARSTQLLNRLLAKARKFRSIDAARD